MTERQRRAYKALRAAIEEVIKATDEAHNRDLPDALLTDFVVVAAQLVPGRSGAEDDITSYSLLCSEGVAWHQAEGLLRAGNRHLLAMPFQQKWG